MSPQILALSGSAADGKLCGLTGGQAIDRRGCGDAATHYKPKAGLRPRLPNRLAIGRQNQNAMTRLAECRNFNGQTGNRAWRRRGAAGSDVIF